MKAPPSAPFVMSNANFLFEVEIIAFDAPAEFGRIDERRKINVLREGGEPVFGGLGFFLRPFDQKPFFRP